MDPVGRITSILNDVRWSWIAIVAWIVAACSGSAPQPPAVNPPTTDETITGSERIGWIQPAADAAELATIRYAIYVDDVRSEITGVACASAAPANGFACTGRLPALTRGAHALQIASFIVDGAVFESSRSAPLRVTVVAAPATPGVPTVRPGTAVTADGIHLRAELVAEGFDTPTDLAIAPDGRVLVAEAGGRIRIVRNGELLQEPAIALDSTLGDAGRLLAIAIDPQFARTRFVYVAYAARGRSGDMRFAVARLHEAADVLGDVVAVVDGVPAASTPSAALRFGGDGKLYVALDAAGDPRRSGDPGSWNGKLLRMNADGTTPGDQAGGTPVLAAGVTSPAGLAWQAGSGTWWVADRNDGQPLLRSIVQGAARAAYALPADVTPSAIAFYHSDLFPALSSSLLVASLDGARLLRVALDPRTGRPSRIERLLQDRFDGISAVGISADGAIYLTTTNSLARIVRDER